MMIASNYWPLNKCQCFYSYTLSHSYLMINFKRHVLLLLFLWTKKLQRREVTLTSWSKPQAWVMKPDFFWFHSPVLITEFLPPLCSHQMCIWSEVIQSLYFTDKATQHRQIKWFVQSPHNKNKIHIPSHSSLGRHLELSTGLGLEVISFFCLLNFQNVYYGI